MFTIVNGKKKKKKKEMLMEASIFRVQLLYLERIQKDKQCHLLKLVKPLKLF